MVQTIFLNQIMMKEKEVMSEVIPNPYAQDLKRDEKNRQLRVYWKHYVNTFRQSDLTQKEFCSKHGLDYSKFKNWLQRLKPNERATTNNFIPIQVADASDSSFSQDREWYLFKPVAGGFARPFS